MSNGEEPGYWRGMSVKHSLPWGLVLVGGRLYVVLELLVLKHSSYVRWEGSVLSRACPLACDGFSPCM